MCVYRFCDGPAVQVPASQDVPQGGPGTQTPHVRQPRYVDRLLAYNIILFSSVVSTTSAESKLAIKNLLLGLVGVYVSSTRLRCKSRIMLVFS